MNGSRPLLVALDLDGTVVASGSAIRPRVVAAIRRTLAANVPVTLVTGRMYGAAKRFIDACGISGPVVCYQGAGIFDARSGLLEREVALANAVALRAYGAARSHGFHVQFYRDDRCYVEEDNRFARLYAQISGLEPVVVRSLPEDFAGRDSTKVNLVTDAERAPEAEALMRAVCGADAYVTRSNPEFVELLNPAVDKGEALRLVAAQAGIPMERVLAVGDSYNDLPLLRVAGFAVAMGSAPPELKAIAHAVVADVAHDGVVEALERFVLAGSEASA